MNDQLTTPNGEALFFHKGITDGQIDQLIHYAQTDDGVKNFTSDPKRFASRETFNAWRKPEAVFYTLVDEENRLMGIIWLEELELPEFELPKNIEVSAIDPNDYHTTFAIRLYGKARGQGLSSPFTKLALDDYKLNHPEDDIWLATSPDNIAAINSYKKSGFVELGMRQDGQKLLMILP
jgi:RimJ/RimL family protein N-acetyltransferase